MGERAKVTIRTSELLKLVSNIDNYLKESPTLENELIELVNIYVSQINGCAFCLNVHLKNAKKLALDETKIALVTTWREASIYTEKERAALNLAKHVTQISQLTIPNQLIKDSLEVFTEKEYIELLFAINSINSWNRLMLGTGALA